MLPRCTLCCHYRYVIPAAGDSRGVGGETAESTRGSADSGLGMMAVPFLQQVANAATVSDNFNRANGGLGSNWTTVAGTTAPKIANNTLQPGQPAP